MCEQYDGYAIAMTLEPAANAWISQCAAKIEKSDLYYEIPTLYIPHITLIRELKEKHVKQCLLNLPQKQFIVLMGETFCLKTDKYDVIAKAVYSYRIFMLNKSLREKLYIQGEYPYRAHITLGFVKKGAGKNYLNLGNDMPFQPYFSTQTFMLFNSSGELKAMKAIAA